MVLRQCVLLDIVSDLYVIQLRMLARRGITVSSCVYLVMMEHLPVLVKLASLLIQMDSLAMVRISI